MNAHEEQFALNFISSQKRERYLSFLRSEKGRKKLMTELDQCDDLDKRYMLPIKPAQQTAENISNILQEKNAPETCYVISSNSKTDAKEMSLHDALSKTVGYGAGTFISCIPGKLGYFEFEDPGKRYIIEKK